MITALLDLMGAYFQAGNPGQMATIARSILASIPNDVVALHFLGLALYQMGRLEAARKVFRQASDGLRWRRRGDQTTTGEMAATRLLMEASTPASGLGEAWRHIARAMRDLGFSGEAKRAYEASLLARGMVLQGGTEVVPITAQARTSTTNGRIS